MHQINYPHLASDVFNTPLMCTQGLFDSVQSALIPRIIGAGSGGIQAVGALAAGIDEQDEERVAYNTHQGVAVIPVHGILTTRRGGIDAQCREVSSYEKSSALLDAALQSEEVEHIVLDVNTPGGAAVGCFDFAERVYQAGEQKPVTAIVNFSAYSAGYMIASAANEIIVSDTSGVGSIGVIAGHVDMSKALEANGLNVTMFYRGDHKNDLSPHEPVTDAAAAVLNAELDDLYLLFVEKVARNRGLSVETVMDTEAKTYRGQKAIDAGLADKLMYPQDAINSIAQAIIDKRAQKRVSVSANTSASSAEVPAKTQKSVARQAAAMAMQASV